MTKFLELPNGMQVWFTIGGEIKGIGFIESFDGIQYLMKLLSGKHVKVGACNVQPYWTAIQREWKWSKQALRDKERMK